jgi:hypothetical protein
LTKPVILIYARLSANDGRSKKEAALARRRKTKAAEGV